MSLRLDTDKKNFWSDIIQNQKNCYQVPFYQRQLVWKQDKVQGILEDVFSSSDKDPCFIGTFIFSTEDESSKDIHVVDGQQRMSTFKILQSVLRDIYYDYFFVCYEQAQLHIHMEEYQEMIAMYNINRYVTFEPSSEFKESFKKYVSVPTNTLSSGRPLQEIISFHHKRNKKEQDEYKSSKEITDSDEHLINNYTASLLHMYYELYKGSDGKKFLKKLEELKYINSFNYNFKKFEENTLLKDKFSQAVKKLRKDMLTLLTPKKASKKGQKTSIPNSGVTKLTLTNILSTFEKGLIKILGVDKKSDINKNLLRVDSYDEITRVLKDPDGFPDTNILNAQFVSLLNNIEDKKFKDVFGAKKFDNDLFFVNKGPKIPKEEEKVLNAFIEKINTFLSKVINTFFYELIIEYQGFLKKVFKNDVLLAQKNYFKEDSKMDKPSSLVFYQHCDDIIKKMKEMKNISQNGNNVTTSLADLKKDVKTFFDDKTKAAAIVKNQTSISLRNGLEHIFKNFKEKYNYDDLKNEVFSLLKNQMKGVDETLDSIKSSQLTWWGKNSYIKAISTFHDVNAEGIKLTQDELLKNVICREVSHSSDDKIKAQNTARKVVEDWDKIFKARKDWVLVNKKHSFSVTDFVKYFWCSRYERVGVKEIIHKAKAKFDDSNTLSSQLDNWINFVKDLQDCMDFYSAILSTQRDGSASNTFRAFLSKKNSLTNLTNLQLEKYFSDQKSERCNIFCELMLLRSSDTKTWIYLVFPFFKNLSSIEQWLTEKSEHMADDKKSEHRKLSRQKVIKAFKRFARLTYMGTNYQLGLGKNINKYEPKLCAFANKLFPDHEHAFDKSKSKDKFDDFIKAFETLNDEIEGLCDSVHPNKTIDTEIQKYLDSISYKQSDEQVKYKIKAHFYLIDALSEDPSHWTSDISMLLLSEFTIEHIIPQKPTKTKWGFDPEEIADDCMNNIGNLLPFEGVKNLSRSNKSYIKSIEEWVACHVNLTKCFPLQNTSKNWGFDTTITDKLTTTKWSNAVVKRRKYMVELLKKYIQSKGVNKSEKLFLKK